MPTTFWLKFAGVAALIAIASYGTWYATSDHYQVKIEAMQRDWQAAYAQATQMQLDESQHNLQLRQTAEAQHAQDQLALNDLAHQLNGMHIHLPACGGSAGQTDSTSPSADRAAGIFSARLDAAFAKLQDGIGRLAQRCDQINIDARAMNKALGN